jgi:cell division protease FtsH
MSAKLGPVVLSEREETVFLGRELGGQRNHSDEKAFQIDEEIMKIIKTAQQKAETVLTKNKTLLKKITVELIKKETIEGKDFDKFFK